MKTIIYFIIITAFLNIDATCSKRADCREMDLSFEGFYKAYPDRDSIRTADTIWLESSIPVLQKNLATGEIVNFTGAVNLGFSISYIELKGGDLNSPGAISSAAEFTNVLIKGIESVPVRPEQIRNFRFVEENGFYHFKLAIIPKKRGLFAIAPGNSGSVYTNDNKCWEAGFSLTFKDTNQRIFLYEQSRPGYAVSAYERSHMYVFRVY